MALEELKNTPLDYIPGKEPPKEKPLVYDHSMEITWATAEKLWETVNEIRAEKSLLGGDKCQVVVFQSEGDVTMSLYEKLLRSPLGEYGATTVHDKVFPDTEFEAEALNALPGAEHIYFVASLVKPEDIDRVLAVGNYYKKILNAKQITLVCSFLRTTRQDKNVDKTGDLTPSMPNIYTTLQQLASVVDRMIVFEPHSSSTQAFAAQLGVPLAPLSPWRYLMEQVFERGSKKDGKHVDMKKAQKRIVRPDKGRYIAAARISNLFGILSIICGKMRVSPTETRIIFENLPQEMNNITALCFDDEINTMETVGNIANGLSVLAFIIAAVHAKFTNSWKDIVRNPKITKVFVSDSRKPVGDINDPEIKDKVEVISLATLVYGIIRADMQGINFWKDKEYSTMLLQTRLDEDCKE